MSNRPALAEQAKRFIRPIVVVAALGGVAYGTPLNADAKQPAKAKYGQYESVKLAKFIIPGSDSNNCKFERLPLTGYGWPEADSIEGKIECPDGTKVEVSAEFDYKLPGQGWRKIDGHGQTAEATSTENAGFLTDTSKLQIPTQYLHELHDKGDALRWKVTYNSANHSAISSAVMATTVVEGPVTADYYSPGSQH